jgi:hypothetical protein
MEDSEINREKEQIKLLKKGIDEINQRNPLVDEIKQRNPSIDEIKQLSPSIDEMWNAIEKFGVKRESVDPRNIFTYYMVHDLYLTIKNDNPPPEENKIKNQENQPISHNSS